MWTSSSIPYTGKPTPVDETLGIKASITKLDLSRVDIFGKIDVSTT
jgi:hypothetical protein